MPLLLLNEDELRQTITLAEAIDKVRNAFAALAEDRVDIPGGFILNLPAVHGRVSVKGAYLEETPYYVIKMGSDFQDNPTINLPVSSGLTTVFDAATGFPVAVMFDNGYLTRVRAGAAGALTVEYLANEHLERVAVIGTGHQAYIQIKSAMMVRDITNVSIWGPTPVKVDNYARLIVEDHDLNVEIAPTVEAAVTGADLIITTTPSRKPLVYADWLKPGVHIIAVGSDKPTKQELHVDVLKRADLIVVDKFEQCAAIGEVHHGIEAGVITADDIYGELGDLIIGKMPGRTSPEQITVADLTGLDVQDATVATIALEKALFLDLGQRIEGRVLDFSSAV